MTLSTTENLIKSEDLKKIVNSLVLAFSADPVVRWMYPSPQQYLSSFPNFISAFGKRALDSGTVYYPENYSGAAFWFPPGVEPDSDLVMDTLRQTISKEHQTKVFSLLEEMSKFHPGEPHWYLGILGIDPAQQNRGYGSELIRDILNLCDRFNLPAYLESSNPRNIAFYERHGFKVAGEIRAFSSPTMLPMMRYPQKYPENTADLKIT